MTHKRTGRQQPSWQTVAVLFFLGWTLIYANRNVLSAVLSQISVEWELSHTGLGLLNSAFFLAYTVGQVPTGFLADRFSRRLLLLPGYFLQSVACVMSGFATGPASLLNTRVAAGLGQSTYYSAQYALASQYLPENRRAFGMALINSGMAAGIIFGLGIATTFVHRLQYHWRAPFVVVGALGLCLMAVMHFVIKEKAEDAPTSSNSAAGCAESTTSNPFKDRSFWLICAATFGAQYGFYVILSWLPFYLEEARGFVGSQAGLVSILMPLIAAPSAVMIGWFSDRSGRRKRLALWLVPLSMIALALIGLWENDASLFAGLALYGLAGKMSLDPILVSLIVDRVGASKRASAFGVFNFASAVSMVSAPALTGYFADTAGGFRASFLLAIALALLALLSLLFVEDADTRKKTCTEPVVSTSRT